MATKNTARTNYTGRKTTCPITRAQFTQHGANATPVVSIAGQAIGATPKTFSTSSVGYYASGKVQIMIDGIPVWCQVGLNITVIGSGELPELPTVVSPEVQAIHDRAKAVAAAAVANMTPGDGLAILDAMPTHDQTELATNRCMA